MSSAPNLTATEHFNKTAAKYEATTGGGTRELGQHAISLIAGLKPLTSESKILDNACGTGIVTDIILQSGIQPEIHAVDGAENMVSIARDRFSSHPNVHAAVMTGEELSFPDDTFTHSITNLGLMFFTDADKGAREIARTLHPDGVAVVTGWAMMGHIKIIQEVQAQIRPDDTPFKLPVPDIWLDPEHTKAVLSGAGLDVQVSTARDVHLGGETADGIADLLTQAFGSKAFGSWSEEEKDKAAGLMKKIVRERAVPFTRPSGSGVGIKLTGTIFVARRGSGRVLAI
ncbi:Methyltransf-25 domain-containing protein [Fusarium falciforme]|uniref:Methyltransf-25 domain-containing protein n=1 Tax=Fusarium falciforme TaxID=195108 RepID=UPI002300DF0C|nr:Methyltransf-25 domain-containing protein [Fusarium falciforme]WAO85584.1 Methyltransf-25 domain-containing protein [Fusarium falciforme]